jgi:PIN domain nuclease of toxin-antitoxin system
MDLLLNTHTFIWFLNGDKQLNSTVKNLITHTSNKCYVSIASIWEMVIKSSLNKLELNGNFDQIALFLNENDIELLPITFYHIQHLLHLDFHHRDPFDRIIIAQAFNESLTLATKDSVFDKYPVNTIWK